MQGEVGVEGENGSKGQFKRGDGEWRCKERGGRRVLDGRKKLAKIP